MFKNLFLVLFLVPLLTYGQQKHSIKQQNVEIGSGASDKTITFKNGSTNPKIKYSNSSGKIEFSNDGTNFKKLGSGSGGGSGINEFEQQEKNWNAEEGTTGWTETSSTLSVVSKATDPDEIIEGDFSFRVDFDAQNDAQTSPVVSVAKDYLYGEACEANFKYYGFDDKVAIQVINGDSEVLGEADIPASSSKGTLSVFFLCPSSSAIAGDADKGNLRFKVYAKDSGDPAVGTYDLISLGLLNHLESTEYESVQKYEISQAASSLTNRVDEIEYNLGTATISNSGNSLITVSDDAGNTRTKFTANEKVKVFVYADFGSVASSSSCLTVNGTVKVVGTQASTTNQNVQVSGLLELNANDYFTLGACGNSRTLSGTIPSIAVPAVLNFVAYSKVQGKVYKSIPKVADNINEFSAKISATRVKSDENVSGWISSVANGGGSGTDTINFASIFTVNPNCSATVQDESAAGATAPGICGVMSGGTASSVNVQCKNGNASTGVAHAYVIKCQKTGIDYKTPVVQPIVVGQVTSGANILKNISADVNCDASSTVTSQSGGISLVGNRSTTSCALTLQTGFFSTTPYKCIPTVKSSTAAAMSCSCSSATSCTIYGPNADYDAYVEISGIP